MKIIQVAKSIARPIYFYSIQLYNRIVGKPRAKDLSSCCIVLQIGMIIISFGTRT